MACAALRWVSWIIACCHGSSRRNDSDALRLAPLPAATHPNPPGIGTFYPLFYTLAIQAKQALVLSEQQGPQGGRGGGRGGGAAAAAGVPMLRQRVRSLPNRRRQLGWNAWMPLGRRGRSSCHSRGANAAAGGPLTPTQALLVGGNNAWMPLPWPCQALQPSPPPRLNPAGSQMPTPRDAEGLAAQAFIDPNDPTTVFLSQPVDESQRLKEAPRCGMGLGVCGGGGGGGGGGCHVYILACLPACCTCALPCPKVACAASFWQRSLPATELNCTAGECLCLHPFCCTWRNEDQASPMVAGSVSCRVLPCPARRPNKLPQGSIRAQGQGQPALLASLGRAPTYSNSAKDAWLCARPLWLLAGTLQIMARMKSTRACEGGGGARA